MSTIQSVGYCWTVHIGIWSIKLLVLAALAWPGMVGWSGISDKYKSRLFLNASTFEEFKFLSEAGSKLNKVEYLNVTAKLIVC